MPYDLRTTLLSGAPERVWGARIGDRLIFYTASQANLAVTQLQRRNDATMLALSIEQHGSEEWHLCIEAASATSDPALTTEAAAN